MTMWMQEFLKEFLPLQYKGNAELYPRQVMQPWRRLQVLS